MSSCVLSVYTLQLNVAAPWNLMLQHRRVYAALQCSLPRHAAARAGVAPDASVSRSNAKLQAVAEEDAAAETGGQVEAESSLPFTPITLVCQVNAARHEAVLSRFGRQHGQ